MHGAHDLELNASDRTGNCFCGFLMKC